MHTHNSVSLTFSDITSNFMSSFSLSSKKYLLLRSFLAMWSTNSITFAHSFCKVGMGSSKPQEAVDVTSMNSQMYERQVHRHMEYPTYV